MLEVGDHYRDIERDGPRAQGWYASANHYGELDGAMRLADLYRSQLTGLSGGPKDAAALYEELGTKFDRADARRQLALMLVKGEGIAKDADRARQLLLKDAENDDAISRRVLGVLMLDGDLGSVDEAQGQRWLGLAVDQGNTGAMNDWASWLYRKKGGPGDVAKAKTLWQRAIANGSKSAINELAWAACTATNAAMYDPGKGLAVIQKMDRADLTWARIDTLAACQAANGDFQTAQATQVQAIEQLKAKDPASSSLANVQARLELYKQHKTYRSNGED
jgi:TPR repeat protein